MANNYPPTAFYFKAEFGLDGVQNNNSNFQEVSGLSTESNVVEYREGGENRFKYRLPTQVKSSNLSLKRGIISDPAIIKWINNSIVGDLSEPIKTIDLTITLINEENEPAMRWKFSDAWVVKIEVAELKAQSNEIVIESIECAYSTMTREDV